MSGFADLFPELKTPSQKRRSSRQKWQKIKRGGRAKSFLKRQEAARNLKAHREELDEKGILQDQFNFLKEPNPRWVKTRLFILKRDRFRCLCCGKQHRKNHVHHKIPRRYAGSSDSKENLVTLCPKDHSWVDLEIFRRLSMGAPNSTLVRSVCYQVLEERKKMVQAWQA